MFGLEVKAPARRSQEDNGKEREKKGRFMDVCLPSQVVGTLMLEGLCVSKRAR